MATARTEARRKAEAAAKAAAATDFSGVRWDYDDPLYRRKSALEGEARTMVATVVVLLNEAGRAGDDITRTALALAAARRLAEAQAFFAPFSGLDLPDLLK